MDRPDGRAHDVGRMRDYARDQPQPSPYQHLGNGAGVSLSAVPDGASPDALLASMSAEDRLGQPGIALLMDACFGERGTIDVAGGGTCLLKSIPSGGARHPTEAFLAAFDVHGLPAAVYHYAVEGHRLEQVSDGDRSQEFAAATLDLFVRYDRPPSAILVLTSLVERAMWRYRDPRSARAILVDVGHAAMAARHTAQLLGYRTYSMQKMRDSAVAELIGVDPVVQPPLQVVALFR